MRVREELRRSGFFWLPSTPDHKIPGTLLITDGGHIELEVVGLFEETESIEGLSRVLNGSNEIGNIVGSIEQEGFVTLNDCYYKNKNFSFGGISRSRVYVGEAILGVAYDEAEVPLFNTFQFSVDGLNEWVGRTGIAISHDFGRGAVTVTYAPPEEVSLNLPGEMRLTVKFHATVPLMNNGREAKITQSTFLHLASAHERSLEDFRSTAHKITNLLGFAIDETVGMEAVTATSYKLKRDWGDGKTSPVPVSLYYRSLPHPKDPPKIDAHQMLFTLGQILGDAELIMDKWFDAYEVIDPALNLYFSAKTGAHKYLEGTFLSLAQAVETYHRRTSSAKLMDDSAFEELTKHLTDACPPENREWLQGRLAHGNEVNLGRRLKGIIEPFKNYLGPSKQRGKLIQCIVDTRNYLTHYDKFLETKAASGKDLWRLCEKLEAIFQLHLLHVLGFSKTEIQSVFDNSRELQGKLKSY